MAAILSRLQCVKDKPTDTYVTGVLHGWHDMRDEIKIYYMCGLYDQGSVTSQGPLLLIWTNLITSWIRNYTHYRVLD